MKKEVRAALYARCSTHDKGQDPELQLAPLREYCQRRDLTITGEVDNGISGTKDRCPQLDRLMEAARKRQIDLILVWEAGQVRKETETACGGLRGAFSYRDRVYYPFRTT